MSKKEEIHNLMMQELADYFKNTPKDIQIQHIEEITNLYPIHSHNSMNKKTVFSGIQPTGQIHLGNYLGTISLWSKLQNIENYKCSFGIMDLHSMTNMVSIGVNLEANKGIPTNLNYIFQLMSCDIKLENIFIQSDLSSQLMRLFWILSTSTSVGELLKMPQYSDKKKELEAKNKQSLIPSSLLLYPLLQVSDILLFNSDIVPIGIDQVSHIELVNTIVDRLHYHIGLNKDSNNLFKRIEPMYNNITKVHSFADPSKKMSKSLGDKHVLNMNDDKDTIINKLKTAVTESANHSSGYEFASQGVKNLMNIISELDNKSYLSMIEDYNNNKLDYRILKQHLTELLIKLTTTYRTKYNELINSYTTDILFKEEFDIQVNSIKQMNIELSEQRLQNICKVLNVII